jgi:hypothetical protein
MLPANSLLAASRPGLRLGSKGGGDAAAAADAATMMQDSTNEPVCLQPLQLYTGSNFYRPPVARIQDAETQWPWRADLGLFEVE